ncbi:phytoene/squalene synthetase [Thiohalobacter thiocyanaticus]|uniref:Phytoene/squalene synthetase n=1 Tax=Thiohalobacter thiocyanaticus TaxID=585455 RepID=A0A1Z4VSV1_9GAMM|nr:squalene synthase HpnC [Thiohalobacter thiocyanaticus]BAZ94573.1 phytoene/squalene synthetase [Thiohalobacter thiocyanaticus]
MSHPELARAYRHCRALARSHYENFPVASLLLPRRLRDPVAAIYAFARHADDLADEGDAPPEARLAALADWETGLLETLAGQPAPEPILLACSNSILRFGLPVELFQDLLSAFRQDVTQTRYDDFGELMQYCRRSANPVGRLLLRLHGVVDPRREAESDAICSALQLINFYQDLRQDILENDRIYLPLDELERFEVSEDDLRAGRDSTALRRLLQFQYNRARRLLRSGAPLGRALRGRFGLEIRAIVLGGSRVLDRLQNSAPFARPRLTTGDRLWLLWHALRKTGPVPQK